ncbi:(Fe-S)-binding protein [Thiogranum longum]|nr:(Fe-S)-binding protein [Thiogranum longum]
MDDLSATDRCVKCGLCLPHCPTFTLTGNEADSPRGRISLMQWLEASPEISQGFLNHIDRCLQCGACEAMCPSKVPFGALMDTARTRLAPQHRQGFSNRLLAGIGSRVLASPRALRLAGPVLGGYRRLGLPALLGKLPGTVGRLNRLLSRKTGAGHRLARPAGNLPRLHLFPGCTGHALDRQTLYDAQQLLRARGYDAVISRETACCGALQQHIGQADRAAALARHNHTALGDDEVPVISIASGCAAHLQGYDAVDTLDASAPFSSRVSEIMAFLAEQDAATVRFDPCEEPVGVYVPCTQRNALRQSQALFDVLRWIPGLETRHINPQGGCCGAAGSYMVTQPAFSDALGDAVVERIIDSAVRTLVTTNIGCSIQLQARLRARGIEVEVIHPVTLLLRQLRSQ